MRLLINDKLVFTYQLSFYLSRNLVYTHYTVKLKIESLALIIRDQQKARVMVIANNLIQYAKAYCKLWAWCFMLHFVITRIFLRIISFKGSLTTGRSLSCPSLDCLRYHTHWFIMCFEWQENEGHGVGSCCMG